MHIYLSSSFQLNARYHTADGQVLYRTQTPHKGTGSITTITKVVPSDPSSRLAAATASSSDANAEEGEEEPEPEPNAAMQHASSKMWSPNNPFRSTSTPGAGADVLAELEEEQGHASNLKPSTSRYADDPDMPDMQDVYADVAQVKWSWFASSAVRYFSRGEGQDVSTDVYFGKTGFGPYGR